MAEVDRGIQVLLVFEWLFIDFSFEVIVGNAGDRPTVLPKVGIYSSYKVSGL